MTPQELLTDPDFRESTPETQRWALQQVDPKRWGNASQQDFDAFMGKVKPAWKRETEQNKVITGQMAQLQPPAPPQAPKHVNKTMWQKAVAPVTDLVGQGMESLTKPLVPLTRLLKGESNPLEGYAKGDFQGAGGTAAETRQQAASPVVPQSPWQAGAMGAQFVPGVAPAGALARVGAAGVGGGALQGLFGEKGLVEGGGLKGAGREAAGGTVKSMLSQGAGEIFGKLLGAGRRGTAAVGLTESTPSKDVRRVVDTARKISPELQPGKGAAAAGEYFAGSKGAEEAAGAAFKASAKQLERKLNDLQGDPYIRSTDLIAAWNKLSKKLGKDSLYKDQLAALQPNKGGFLPEQAQEILALIRDDMKLSQTAGGHFNQTALNNLVAKIEASLPTGAQGILTAGRKGMATASGIAELLGDTLKAGKKGYTLDIAELQRKLATDPDLAARIGPEALAELVKSATRGAGKGFADVRGSGNISYPYHLAPTGVSFAALRNFLTRGTTVGKHPQALQEGTKAGLGIATTANASALERWLKGE